MRFDPQLTRQRLSQVMGRIRAAVLDISPAMKEAEARKLEDSLAGEAGEVLGKSKSLSAMMRRVEQKLQDAAPRNDPYPWVRDWFESDVVYEQGGKLYRRSFELGDDDAVTLGDPVEVEIQYKSAEAVEPGRVAAESDAELHWAAEAVGEGLIKIIKAGKGSSGQWLKETLKRDGPAAWPAGTHMYWDHPTESEARDRPERSLSTLAGVLKSDAKWMDEGPKGPGLYARAQVRSPFKEALADIGEHIGVSVRAWVTKEGEKITGIVADSLNSVDFVTKPGAGGAIAQAFESVGRGPGNPQPSKEGKEMDKSEMKELLNEALEPFGKRLEALEAGQKRGGAAVEALNKRLGDQEIRTAAREAVKDAELPDVAKARVVEALVSKPPVNEDGSLNQEALSQAAVKAIASEKEYLAAVGGGQVTGMGGAAATTDAVKESSPDGMIAHFRSRGYSEEAARRMAGAPAKEVN